MISGDYIALIGAVTAMVGLLGSWTYILHSQRARAFEDFRRSMEARHNRTDADVRALQTQMGTLATDLSKGYVGREEFRDAMEAIARRMESATTEASRRLDQAMRDWLQLRDKTR